MSMDTQNEHTRSSATPNMHTVSDVYKPLEIIWTPFYIAYYANESTTCVETEADVDNTHVVNTNDIVMITDLETGDVRVSAILDDAAGSDINDIGNTDTVDNDNIPSGKGEIPHSPSRAGSNSQCSICKRRLWSVWCWIIIVYSWVDAVRIGTVFKSGISATSSDFTLLSYIVFQISCGYLVLVSYKYGMKNHSRFVKGLTEYYGRYGCQLNLHKLTRFSRIAAVVVVILDVCFSTINVIPTYIHSVPVESFSKRLLTPIHYSLQNPMFHAFTITSWIARILGTSLTFSLPLHYIITAYIFSKEYASITKDIKTAVGETSNNITNTLERLRIRFEELTETFNRFNGVVCHYVFVAYVTSVCNTCFFLYTAINGDVPEYDMYVYMFLMTSSLLQLVGITATATWLHNKIHEPLEALMRIHTGHLDCPTIQRISLFVSRLYGSKIGISVYGMFVIDSSTFLMLFGTILTYFVVVFEMRPKH